MVRVPMVPVEAFEPELRALVRADERSAAELGNLPLYAHNPKIATSLVRFQAALRTEGTLSRRLVELVRLRIAFHNQCSRCMSIRSGDGVDEGVTEALVCQLAQPDVSDDLSDAERSALRFADLMATDHESITDDLIQDLARHFTDAQVVELGMNIAMHIGFGRLSRALDSLDDVPDAFLTPPDGTPVFPWSGPGVVVR